MSDNDDDEHDCDHDDKDDDAQEHPAALLSLLCNLELLHTLLSLHAAQGHERGEFRVVLGASSGATGAIWPFPRCDIG